MKINLVSSPNSKLDCVSELETYTDAFAKFLDEEDENIPPRILEELARMHEELAEIYDRTDEEVHKLENDLEDAKALVEALEGGEQE